MHRLGMMCALVGSSVWVNNATRLGLAVSSSHSIVGATIGVGIAFRGPSAVLWGACHSLGLRCLG
jgi:sodium-dependent phosphate transporter